MEWFPILYRSRVPGDSCSDPCPRAAKFCPNKIVAKASEESELGYAEEGQASSGVAGWRDTHRVSRGGRISVTPRGFPSLSPE